MFINYWLDCIDRDWNKETTDENRVEKDWMELKLWTFEVRRWPTSAAQKDNNAAVKRRVFGDESARKSRDTALFNLARLTERLPCRLQWLSPAIGGPVGREKHLTAVPIFWTIVFSDSRKMSHFLGFVILNSRKVPRFSENWEPWWHKQYAARSIET